MTPTIESKSKPSSPERVPRLRSGDHLTAAEFERRYEAMPDLKKAELVEGVVYMPSPVSMEEHGAPHFDLIVWLGTYRALTPGVQGGDNATIRLDAKNRPQPDACLRVLPAYGGQSATSSDGYVENAPEFVSEVSASSVSYDLHEKLGAYRRNSVQEYVVWRVEDSEVDWFRLRDGEYKRLEPTSEGIYKSEVFPGLWLDARSLIKGDLAKVLQVLQAGIASPEHADFVKQLAAKRSSTSETGR